MAPDVGTDVMCDDGGMDPIRIQHADEWQRRISESFFPLALTAAPNEFEASIRTTDLPRGIRVSEVHVAKSQVRRTERHVRGQQSDHVLALFQYSGTSVIRQAGREVHLTGGAATINDPSAPYEVTMLNDSHQVIFLVPTAALRAAGADITQGPEETRIAYSFTATDPDGNHWWVNAETGFLDRLRAGSRQED